MLDIEEIRRILKSMDLVSEFAYLVQALLKYDLIKFTSEGVWPSICANIPDQKLRDYLNVEETYDPEIYRLVKKRHGRKSK